MKKRVRARRDGDGAGGAVGGGRHRQLRLSRGNPGKSDRAGTAPRATIKHADVRVHVCRPVKTGPPASAEEQSVAGGEDDG
ncbi:hypothetical protein AAFF_G00310750 [Aldrovandia affinis]|uniref:Uncharacterized protein n=1 Tax=Aldrovandia affinis TaxID=143900 RepID=A0AAD7R8F5_9TELE|nr:hypothetical protein AAFF_G00310750 [Aldrovandia affinis]